MSKKVVVLGVNHAGTSAVKTLLMQDPTLKVVGLESSDVISFLGCGIALAVGDVVKDPTSLFYASISELEAMGAEIKKNHEATKVDHANKVVHVKNLKTGATLTESYDALVYAAGSWPFIMPFHKPEYQGVKLCKTYEQALELIADAKNNHVKNVVILGAGYIGIELTEAYAHSKNAKHVTLIDMENRVVPRYFDTEFTNLMEASMHKSGVQMLMNTKVVEILVDNNNQVTGLKAVNVKTDETTVIPADLVISCVGFRPRTDLLLESMPNLATSRNKAIQVNEYAQALDTNNQPVDGLYVIGDAAATYYMPTKTHENVALATNAVKLGVVAGAHIAATHHNKVSPIKLESISGTNAISVFDYSFSSTGLSAEGAKRLGIDADSAFHVGNDRCEFMNDYSEINIKLVWEKSTLRLIGAQIGSHANRPHTEAIYMLSLAIQKQMTLYDLITTDVYFLPHLNKPFNYLLCCVCKALNLKYGDHVYLPKK